MDLQPAFVLHLRAYRETSVLVDMFTQKSGRICLIARGARTIKSSWKGILQPFVPLVVNWYGRGELPTLKTAEVSGKTILLKKRALLSGFYLNELLMRVLPRGDGCEEIFRLYGEAIENLSLNRSEQITLRYFEKRLLKALGYALQLTREANSDQAILSDEKYIFSPSHGFSLVQSHDDSGKNVFQGESLLAISRDDYTDVSVLRDAKRLMRLAFSSLLGDRPLKSRELFR